MALPFDGDSADGFDEGKQARWERSEREDDPLSGEVSCHEWIRDAGRPVAVGFCGSGDGLTGADLGVALAEHGECSMVSLREAALEHLSLQLTLGEEFSNLLADASIQWRHKEWQIGCYYPVRAPF